METGEIVKKEGCDGERVKDEIIKRERTFVQWIAGGRKWKRKRLM